MSTGTNIERRTDAAAPPKLVAFIGKYARTVAGAVNHLICLTAAQALEEYAGAQAGGALLPSTKEPGEGFSFLRLPEPEGAEGPAQAVDVVPLDDWLLQQARRDYSNTTPTLVRVLQLLKDLP